MLQDAFKFKVNDFIKISFIIRLISKNMRHICGFDGVGVAMKRQKRNKHSGGLAWPMVLLSNYAPIYSLIMED